MKPRVLETTSRFALRKKACRIDTGMKEMREMEYIVASLIPGEKDVCVSLARGR